MARGTRRARQADTVDKAADRQQATREEGSLLAAAVARRRAAAKREACPARADQPEPAETQDPPPAPTPPQIVGGVAYTGPALEQFAGADAARAWGERLVRDLDDYTAGRIGWQDVDRGAVLCGPTGTGKTSIVRAIAAAAGVSLIVTSYREWMCAKEGHLGNLMQAMQDVFKEAIRQRPCLLLIDELDSLPTRLGAHEHKDWYIGIINALLELLDGGNQREGVVVVGACNDPSRLDAALVRPGRLERKIAVELPDTEALTKILEFHVAGAVPSAELGAIAILASGSSGAEVEALVREARRTARHAKRPMRSKDLREAALGFDGDVPADLLHRTAVHEAGHAFAALRFDLSRSVSVSIARRGDTLGSTRIEPIMQSQTRDVLEREIALHLAGRAAEDVILGSASSGAGGDYKSDLANATRAALRLVAAYGFSENAGLVWHSEQSREHLLLSNPKTHTEVQNILDQSYGRITALLRRERAAFEQLANALVKRRGLAHAEIVALLGEPTTHAPPRIVH